MSESKSCPFRKRMEYVAPTGVKVHCVLGGKHSYEQFSMDCIGMDVCPIWQTYLMLKQLKMGYE